MASYIAARRDVLDDVLQSLGLDLGAMLDCADRACGNDRLAGGVTELELDSAGDFRLLGQTWIAHKRAAATVRWHFARRGVAQALDDGLQARVIMAARLTSAPHRLAASVLADDERERQEELDDLLSVRWRSISSTRHTSCCLSSNERMPWMRSLSRRDI